MVQGYAKLRELMPLLAKYQGKGVMNGLLFDSEHKERILAHDGVKIICRHYFTLRWDPRATNGSAWPEGGGIVLRLAENEYLIAGSGIVVEFEKEGENKARKTLGEDGFASAGGNQSQQEQWTGKARMGIGSADEVQVNADGSFRYLRRFNGDQNHQGRHVRIPVDDFSILHVRLYEYK